MKKTLITLLMVLLCAMLIISCSNEPKDEGSSTAPAETPTETPTTPTTPTKTTFTVTFDVEGNTTTIASKTTNEDGKVEAPTDKPTKSGQIFDHWATEANGATTFDFDTPINADTTLYAVFRDYTAGDIASFGTYPTNYAITSLKGEDVTWKVLSVDTTNSRMLVISENVLETSSQRSDLSFSSYSGSSIQTYLNGTFITTYGLGNVSIVTVNATAENITFGSGSDKVFLLSKTEAEKTSYFANAAARIAKYNGGTWQWILRSVHSYMNVNYMVGTDGSIGNTGGGLRPAMWVNL